MLNSKQLKCIELMIYSDLTQREIAQELKVSEQTICAWKKKEEFLQKINETVNYGLQALAVKAYRRMDKLIGSADEFIGLSASKDILDRAGYKAKERVSLENDITISVEVEDDG